uniref:Uncharacterized protein n=1 Tax=Meloidogyne enterolobii TaxID=390850 RepID=A0A6V7U7F3_MELEN|nr:unnamed protein product [Meloidogyne enterolobii]
MIFQNNSIIEQCSIIRQPFKKEQIFFDQFSIPMEDQNYLLTIQNFSHHQTKRTTIFCNI